MTCIVGLVHKDKVFIGGDSAASTGTSIAIRKGSKVFARGNFIFGCEGSFRMIQLLKFSLILPKTKIIDVEKYLCTSFVKEVKRLIREGMSENEGNKFGSFLIGYNNRLFEFDEDLQLGENLNGIEAIGSGSDIALGSIFTSKGEPKERIIQALEAATFFNAAVARPFTVLST